MARNILFLTLVWPAIVVADDTILQFYRPFTATTKHPLAVVAGTQSGECLQQSQRLTREDAWRCVAKSIVYDPCFVKPFDSHKEVICPESPWSAKSVQINVASPLDNSHHNILDMSRTYPWAIELTNGEKCQAVESGESYDGLPLRYRCSGQTALIGHVQRCAATWKMLQHNTVGISTVEIGKAWF